MLPQQGLPQQGLAQQGLAQQGLANSKNYRHKRQSLTFESLEHRRLLASDIEQLYDVVHDIASTYISCPATCDDVVQDTMIKIVGRWDKIGLLASTSQNAYLARATRNTFVDWIRADSRKSKLIERAFAEIQVNNTEGPVEALLTAEAQTNMEQWLKNQHGTNRDIIQLRQQGLTMEQISEKLDISKSTVQYRCQRLLEDCFRKLNLEPA